MNTRTFRLLSILLVLIPSGMIAGNRSFLDEELIEQGLSYLREGDQSAAHQSFYMAYQINPNSASAAYHLALMNRQAGDLFSSEQFFLITLAIDPDHAAACISLADLYRSDPFFADHLSLSVVYLEHAYSIKPNWSSIALRIARTYQLLDNWPEAEFYYRRFIEESPDIAPGALIEIADFYYEAGNGEEARRIYQIVETSNTSDDFGQMARTRLLKLDVELEAARIAPFLHSSISPKAEVLSNQGRQALSQGRIKDAEQFYNQAIMESPFYADALIELGDIYLLQERIDDAEKAYIRAGIADPSNAMAKIQLGLLYLDYFGGKLGFKAAETFEQALQLRPEWNELRYFRAKALTQNAQFSEALVEFKRYLDTDPNGSFAQESIRMVANLERQISDIDANTLSQLPHTAQIDNEPLLFDQQRKYAMVNAYLDRKEYEIALETLRSMIQESPLPELYNLKARVHLLMENEPEALAALEKSLELEPIQPDVLEQSGILLYRMGYPERSLENLKDAAKHGHRSATYHLARIQWEQGNYFESYKSINNYLNTTVSGINTIPAQRLKRQIETHFIIMGALSGSVILAGVFIILYRYHRNSKWITIQQLATMNPEVFPDVIRTLSSIHHEILKHNTTFLSNLSHSLMHDSRPYEQIDYCIRRLEGDQQESGVIRRYYYYIDVLQRMASHHGLRLNPATDPVLDPLSHGFQQLSSLTHLLKKLKQDPQHHSSVKISKMLDNISLLINKKGYDALKQTINSLLRMELTSEMILSVYHRVIQEPAFKKIKFHPVFFRSDVSGHVYIQIPQFYLEDILINLIRNAVQSAIAFDMIPVAIGFEMIDQIDPVTFIERIAVRVLDRSPQKMTNELLRGRYVDAGLGLTADLTAKYHGTLEVQEAPPGWSKAVTIIFQKIPVKKQWSEHGAS